MNKRGVEQPHNQMKAHSVDWDKLDFVIQRSVVSAKRSTCCGVRGHFNSL